MQLYQFCKLFKHHTACTVINVRGDILKSVRNIKLTMHDYYTYEIIAFDVIFNELILVVDLPKTPLDVIHRNISFAEIMKFSCSTINIEAPSFLWRIPTEQVLHIEIKEPSILCLS